MNRFTKGKWYIKKGVSIGGIEHVSVYNERGFLCSANTIPVKETQLEGESWLSMRGRTEPQRVANAKESNANMHLISCAPEMYKFLDDIANGRGVDYPIEQLLIKARGEQSYCVGVDDD